MTLVNQAQMKLQILSSVLFLFLSSYSPSYAAKKKAYICTIADDVLIRNINLKPIGKMKKGQCIRAIINADEPAAGFPTESLIKGRSYYSIDLPVEVGHVAREFARIRYR
jgi:hypothetical protein